MKKTLCPVLIGTVILTAVIIAVSALLCFTGILNFSFSKLALGALLGCAAALLNMIFLAISVEKSVEKGKNGARAYMSASYILRLIMIAAVIILAIKLDNIFNYVTAALPLLLQRVVIMVVNARRKKSE